MKILTTHNAQRTTLKLLLVLFLFVQHNMNAQTIKLNAIYNYNDIADTKQLDDNLFGFDITGLFNNINNKIATGQSTVPNNSTFVVNNPNFLDSSYIYIQQLRPKLFRYTAQGNIAHFRPNSKGIGIDTAELNNAFRLGLLSQDDINGYSVNNQLLKDNSFNRNFIYDLIALVKRYQKETGDTIKVIYVANVLQHLLKIPSVIPSNANFTSMYNETFNAIKTLKDSGVVVYGIEFGNELYDRRKLFQTNSNAAQNRTDYIAVINEYITRLKIAFPNVLKYSAPMEWASGYSSNTNVDGILNYVTCNNNTNLDAYSMHDYITVGKTPVPFLWTYLCNVDCAPLNCGNQSDINAYNCLSKSISDKFQSSANGNFCLTQGDANDVLNGYYYKEIRRLRTQYPNSMNKKIWLTEYQAGKSLYINTILHSDFIYRHLFFLLDNYDSTGVNVATYWSLGGDNDDQIPTATRNTITNNTTDPYSSINCSGLNKSAVFTYTNYNGINRVNALAAYYPFQFLGKMFSGNFVKTKNSYPITLPNTTTVNEDNLYIKTLVSPVVNTTTSYGIGTKIKYVTTSKFDLYVYYSNKSNQAITLNIDSLTPILYPSETPVCVQAPCIFYPNKYYSKTDSIKNEYIVAPVINYYFRNSNYTITNTTTTLAPLSVGYIKIPMSKFWPASGMSGRIGNFDESTKIAITPNPNNTGKQQITFTEQNDGNGNITVFDITGKQILTKPIQYTNGNNQYDIDTKNIPAGLYLFTIQTNTINHSEKIIIQ